MLTCTADLHTHTIASTHAYSTVNEYAARAKECGIELLAITDHGPSLHDAPSPWHFMNMRVIPRRLHGVAVLRGIEANILEAKLYPEHLLDCEDTILKELDIVLAGFHSPSIQPTNQKTHTRLLVEAISSGRVHVVSHPGNPRFPIDAKAVAEAATAHHVALEANNASFLHVRKGSEKTCLDLLTAQRDAGGFIAIGSDSHHTQSLGEFAQAIKLVEQVGFPKERIINSTPLQVVDFLEMYHAKQLEDVRSLFV